MQANQNIATIQELYAAFGRGDIPGLVERLAPDIVWENPGPAHISYFGTHRGRQAVLKNIFEFVGANFDVQAFQPTDFLASGDKVVVLIHMEVVLRPTGKRVVQDLAHAWTLKNGLPVHLRDHQDNFALAAAIGN